METFPEKVLITMHSGVGGWMGMGDEGIYKLEETPTNHHIPEVQQPIWLKLYEILKTGNSILHVK
jgi:hypothetical protein